jgi:hypothetical protein
VPGVGGQAERSGRTALLKLVQWIQGLRSRGGGRSGLGCGQGIKDIDWGGGRIRGGRKNKAAQHRAARGREPAVATTRRRQEAGVILTDSPN